MLRKLAKEYSDCFIIVLAVAGLVFSHALMSFALAFMALRFILVDKSRFVECRKDVLLALLAYFALFLAGIAWSSDMNEALKQLNKNLPFLIVPLYFFAIPPLNRKSLMRISFCSIAFLVVASCIALIRLYFFGFEDIRSALPFGSHIRFALFVCTATGFLSIRLMERYKQTSGKEIGISSGLIVYFIAYLVLSSSLTGIMLLLIVFMPVCLFVAAKRMPKRIFSFAVLIFSFAVLIFSFAVSFFAYDYFVPKNGECENGMIENGYCHQVNNEVIREKEREEMAVGLKKYLNIAPDSLFADKDCKYAFTDIASRYFVCKGLARTAENWSRLSPNDIDNIRNGIPNPVYASGNPLKVRIYKTFFEFEAYRKWGKIKGSSLVQKIELWQKGSRIVENGGRWLFGVGTGDLRQELNKSLKESNSQLADSGLMIHNQYLSIFITFGLVGCLVFLFFIIYPAYRTKLYKNAFYIYFLALVLVSMSSEDTLDNQQGIMFFCIMNSFFLSRNIETDKKTYLCSNEL